MENNHDSNNIIGKGTLLKGNLNVPGNIRLEGKVVGNVKSKSKIACGETSFIEGNLVAQNAEIAGKVNEISPILSYTRTTTRTFRDKARFEVKCQ